MWKKGRDKGRGFESANRKNNILPIKICRYNKTEKASNNTE